MKEIISGLYTFDNLLMGRVYLIEDADGLTLIDAGIALSGKKILSQLEKAGHKPTDVKRILITHAHPDHFGALPELVNATGAEVIAHELEKPILEGEITVPTPKKETLSGVSGMFTPPATRAKPVAVGQTFIDGDVLPIMGGLHAIHTPGHAPGHTSYWQPEKRVLITGDVIMCLFNTSNMRLPFASFTVDMATNRASIRRVAELEPAVICFGHGIPLVDNAATKLHAFAATL